MKKKESDHIFIFKGAFPSYESVKSYIWSRVVNVWQTVHN